MMEIVTKLGWLYLVITSILGVIYGQKELRGVAVVCLGILVFLLPEWTYAQVESDYQHYWCKTNFNPVVIEYRLPDRSRVDCVTDEYAIEVDFLHKGWHECIGQARYYASVLEKRPACLLIVEEPEKAMPYLIRYFTAVEGLGFKTFFVTQDQYRRAMQ